MIGGTYNIKYAWKLNNYTIDKTELNIAGDTFAFDVNEYEQDINSIYLQGVSDMALGTITDKNGKIVYIKNNKFTTSNYEDIDDSLTAYIC
jgi:hypothetical protein